LASLGVFQYFGVGKIVYGEFVLDGDPAPSPKRGRASSPILRVRVENLEIGPEVGALPVIANFVALEQ